MKTAKLGELLGEAATKFVEATPLGRDPEPQSVQEPNEGLQQTSSEETLSIAERGN